MTFMQIFSPLIGFIIYPYLVRVVGAENYGLYIFSLSVISYFAILIAFGFSWIGLKSVALHSKDIREKSKMVSTVFTAKILLFIIVFIVLIASTYIVPVFKQHKLIFLLCFLQVALSDILLPVWYFQGVQKVKIIVFVQLFARIISIPLIFLLVKGREDIWIYALINVFCSLTGGSIVVWIMKKYEKIHFHIVHFRFIKDLFKQSVPFFWTEAVGTAKKEIIPIISGIFLGLYEVALFDLANKIILIPRLITEKINAAIFPEIVKNPQPDKIKKIVIGEVIIGILFIIVTIISGYFLVSLLGGSEMLGSYPLLCLLSITILTGLLTGSCINFIFVPMKKYYYILQSQMVSFWTVVIFSIPLLMIWKSITMLVFVITLSGLLEMLYCIYRVKNKNF